MTCTHHSSVVLGREDIGSAGGFVPVTDQCLVGVFSPRCSLEHRGLLLEVTSQKLAGALSSVPVFLGLMQAFDRFPHSQGGRNNRKFHGLGLRAPDWSGADHVARAVRGNMRQAIWTLIHEARP